VLRIVATGEVLRGREELRADAEALLRAFPDLRIERRSTYECGEEVCIIEWTLTGTHEGEYIGIPPTHRSVELPACSIFTLGADGLVGEGARDRTRPPQCLGRLVEGVGLEHLEVDLPGATRLATAGTPRRAVTGVRAVVAVCVIGGPALGGYGWGASKKGLERNRETVSSTPSETRAGLISDEQLQKVTIGERKPHNAPITLVEYDPGWVELFAREADRIRSVLGEVAVLVEHVGSTSVPGLAANPIIDILLVVPNSADEPSYVPSLESAGYVLRVRDPEWLEHRFLKGPDTDINLHVFSVGASEIDRMLCFRDRLRTSQADRDRYERTKRALAQRVWRHVVHYADAKTAVIEEIIDRAKAAQ
jgi:GrpB-like predicted nucleotidyltransferase (UPF0157 family)